MSSAVTRLPEARLEEVVRAYKAATAAKRNSTLLLFGAVVALMLLSGWVTGFDLVRLLGNLGTFTSYFDRILTLDNGPSTGQRVWTDPVEWLWGWRKWLSLLADTLLIAYLGTLLGALAGFLLCFFATANLMPDGRVRWAAKRFLEFCRTVPDIVFALIFVIAFGLGPTPGVLALAIHTAGALGKLFAETVENIDMKPVEGAVATGGSWPQVIRYAVVPQVLPGFTSYTLLRFEINVRQASIMGFVGAGGIGQDLIEAVRKFYYADVSAILLLIVLTVTVIDLATERVRHRLLDLEAAR
jgi:phosphonate transport system permease protein